MKASWLFLFFIFFMPPACVDARTSRFGKSQTLTGHITDAKTGQSIEAVNVFIAQSSVGTLTESDGKFILTNIPSTPFELVVSHLGYETLIRKVSPNNRKEITMNLRLSPNSIDLTEVEVTTLKESKRKRYFKRFAAAFLGSSPNAEKCQIVNPQVLDYKMTGGLLEVSANELIEIKNDALGYDVKFLLESFTQEGNQTQYKGKPLFIVQKSEQEKQKQNWEKQKQKTYLGSQQHFYKSLYNGQLRAEGFIIHHARLKNQSEFETLSPATLHQVWHEQEGQKKQLKINEFLKVEYTKGNGKTTGGLGRTDALASVGRRAEEGMMDQERSSATRKLKHPTSYLFARKSRINFMPNGLPQKAELLVEYGFWSTKGVADLLPFDYEPKIENESAENFQSTKKEKTQAAYQTGKQDASVKVLNDFKLNDLKIPFDEIRKGGPPRDGIPSIDRPQFTTSKYADFISDDEEVLGVLLNGEAKAFPIKIMDRHEVVNDQFNGTSVAVTYCPLCGSGMAFLAEVDGRKRSFGVSGLLFNSDVLLYDRETESLWSQIEMMAVSGESAGQELELLPLAQMTWGQWKKLHPNTLILTTNTGHRRDYDQQAYADYRKNNRLMFPVQKESKQLSRKEKVIGIAHNGKYKAYPFRHLAKAEEYPIIDEWNGLVLNIHYNRNNDTAYITNEKEELIPATTLYWFAWYAFHPKGEVYILD